MGIGNKRFPHLTEVTHHPLPSLFKRERTRHATSYAALIKFMCWLLMFSATALCQEFR
ncbi:hypothetical protein AF72_02730 [Xylella taiwanensis]|uniref:Uncharacterized protein n=1 Tax=Xylella taiwanensis TaxID=1444770 RepID=Z9JMA7_9GAMM|nr:hypothetical protein AF72_02730 [Xylella taiwanensis]